MKKLFYLSLLGGLILFTLAQCKKKENAPVPAKYTVDYNFGITGEYTGLIIKYYETGLTLKEVTNPTIPWQMSFTNFVQGDSVKMEISFSTVIGKDYNYTGEFSVNQGSVIGSMSASLINPPEVILVHDQVTYKIP